LYRIGRDSQVLSLDWDRRHLRVAHWQTKRQRLHLRRLLAAALPRDMDVKNPQNLGAFIRQVLHHEGIRVDAAVVDIPRDQCVLNTMSLPFAAVGDMAGMVQLQMAKELPFPLAAAVVDFAVPDDGRAAGQQVEVLVAAIRAEVLQFYKAVCAAAQLKLERVGLRPYANTAAVHAMLGPDALGRVLYADIGPQMTEIGILREGSLVFSRAGSVLLDHEEDLTVVAVGEPSSPEDRLLEKLEIEITRSVEAYRLTDVGMHFDQIVVGGSSGLEARLAEALHRRFGAHARVYHPGDIVPPQTTGEEPVAAYGAVIGLGLSHSAPVQRHFNFLHPKRPVDAAARRRRRVPLAAAAVLALVMAAYGANRLGIQPVKKEIEAVTKKIEELQNEHDKYEKGVKIAHAARRWQAGQLVWPDDLVELMDELPSNHEQGYLRDLALKADEGRMSFDMAAANPDVITALEQRLNLLVEGPEERPERVFEAKAGQITSTAEGEYPSESKITVRSVRIRKLHEQTDKKSAVETP
jgi:Tfp pilus assembly PilM family ATPase